MCRACVLLIVLSLSVGARAQEVCPWLTQGTAAALMGGNVSMTVHRSAGEGTCDFLRDTSGEPTGSNSLHLRIAVSHLAPKECMAGERLTGVGEDAVLCSTDTEGEHQEIIRGRVRTSYFLLTLAGREASDRALLRRSLEQVAEEVAGSLF